MILEYKSFGEGQPFIFLHGLYGSGDNWFSIARKLMDLKTIFLVDQRNHGNSPHSKEMSYDAMTRDLEEFFKNNKLGKSILLGHSMGGKTAMNFTLQHPDKVAGLILIDVAMRSYSAKGNFAPQTLQHQKIMQSLTSLDITNTSDRTELDSRLKDEFPEKALRHFLLKNLKRNEDGSFYWGTNLEALQNNVLHLMDGVEADENEFFGPTLIVRGLKSGYIQDSDKEQFLNHFPSAKFIDFDTGHWVHAEKPDELIRVLREFIREISN